MQVVECELTEAEQDFYQALYKKSKVTADPNIETSSDAASSETSSIYLCCNVNKCLN
jgi:SNF2 family DNA or RNA helicase